MSVVQEAGSPRLPRSPKTNGDPSEVLEESSHHANGTREKRVSIDTKHIVVGEDNSITVIDEPECKGLVK
jgi:hypothetical protein